MQKCLFAYAKDVCQVLIISMFHGSLELPTICGDLLTKLPIYLVFLQASTMACNFQSK